jgi:hypothetical protein
MELRLPHVSRAHLAAHFATLNKETGEVQLLNMPLERSASDVDVEDDEAEGHAHQAPARAIMALVLSKFRPALGAYSETKYVHLGDR